MEPVLYHLQEEDFQEGWLLHHLCRGAWLLRHTPTTEKRWEKTKNAGDPMSLVVNDKEECCITSASRVKTGKEAPSSKELKMSASLPSHCQRQCTPKRLKYRCWESSTGPRLLDSIRKHQRVTVDILWLSDKYVPMKKPYGDSELQLDRVFTEVGTFQQNSN